MPGCPKCRHAPKGCAGCNAQRFSLRSRCAGKARYASECVQAFKAWFKETGASEPTVAKYARAFKCLLQQKGSMKSSDTQMQKDLNIARQHIEKFVKLPQFKVIGGDSKKLVQASKPSRSTAAKSNAVLKAPKFKRKRRLAVSPWIHKAVVSKALKSKREKASEAGDGSATSGDEEIQKAFPSSAKLVALKAKVTVSTEAPAAVPATKGKFVRKLQALAKAQKSSSAKIHKETSDPALAELDLPACGEKIADKQNCKGAKTKGVGKSSMRKPLDQAGKPVQAEASAPVPPGSLNEQGKSTSTNSDKVHKTPKQLRSKEKPSDSIMQNSHPATMHSGQKTSEAPSTAAASSVVHLPLSEVTKRIVERVKLDKRKRKAGESTTTDTIPVNDEDRAEALQAQDAGKLEDTAATKPPAKRPKTDANLQDPSTDGETSADAVQKSTGLKPVRRGRPRKDVQSSANVSSEAEVIHAGPGPAVDSKEKKAQPPPESSTKQPASPLDDADASRALAQQLRDSTRALIMTLRSSSKVKVRMPSSPIKEAQAAEEVQSQALADSAAGKVKVPKGKASSEADAEKEKKPSKKASHVDTEDGEKLAASAEKEHGEELTASAEKEKRPRKRGRPPASEIKKTADTEVAEKGVVQAPLVANDGMVADTSLVAETPAQKPKRGRPPKQTTLDSVKVPDPNLRVGAEVLFREFNGAIVSEILEDGYIRVDVPELGSYKAGPGKWKLKDNQREDAPEVPDEAMHLQGASEAGA